MCTILNSLFPDGCAAPDSGLRQCCRRRDEGVVNDEPAAFSLGCFALEGRSFPGLVVSGRVLDLTRTRLVEDDATGVNDLLEDWDEALPQLAGLAGTAG